MNYKIIASLLLCTITQYLDNIAGRSMYRSKKNNTPHITTYWAHNTTEKYHLYHSHIQENVIFQQYDADYFTQHLLPQGPIFWRYDHQNSTKGSELSAILETLVKNLQETTYQKKIFHEFTILKNRDYNIHNHSGMLVLKFKRYPFVVKLFIETPATFVKPFSKGFEPSCFFMMGGGINRYLAGFSRIKNLEVIKKKIQEDNFWNKKLSVPRKWFWRPKKVNWFVVHNNKSNKHPPYNMKKIKLPSIYAIICDAIESDTSLHILSTKNRKLGIQLSRFFGIRVDPHINNFMIEKGTKKIVLVDTEHFPTMVGLQKPLQFNNYFEWYSLLIEKCFKDSFLRTKSERILYQTDMYPILSCS